MARFFHGVLSSDEPHHCELEHDDLGHGDLEHSTLHLQLTVFDQSCNLGQWFDYFHRLTVEKLPHSRIGKDSLQFMLFMLFESTILLQPAAGETACRSISSKRQNDRQHVPASHLVEATLV